MTLRESNRRVIAVGAEVLPGRTMPISVRKMFRGEVGVVEELFSPSIIVVRYGNVTVFGLRTDWRIRG